MATKMTAVQWLEIAIQNKLKAEMGPYFAEAFQQAKEMEKEQIIDAYNDGSAEWTDIEYTDAEQYYTSTFNS
jgi:hypothetical protein